MTRINTIPVKELHTVHLIAEYRELPRIFAMVVKAESKGHNPSSYVTQKEFTLGCGHMNFFADKLLWIEKRFYELVDECLHRGLAIKYTRLDGKQMPTGNDWWNDWNPTIESQELIRKRIAERISKNPQKYK